MKRIGFGIVGSGAASRLHLEALSNTENACAIGLYSADTEGASRLASEFGIRCFSSPEELLRCEEINVVNICTPSGTHASFAIQALKAGKHVMVEKPLALTAEEARAVADAAAENNRLCAAFAQLRCFESVQRVRDAIRDGKLGRVVMVSLSMKYRRSARYYAESSWRGTWTMDGGVLMNQGIHGVDLLRYLVGEVKAVSAISKTLVHKIEADDTTAAVLEFENGAVGTLEGTTSVTPGYSRILEINGSQGSVRLEENEIVRWDVEGESLSEVSTGLGLQMNGAHDPNGISCLGHILQIENMALAVQGKAELINDAESGSQTVKLISTIYRSAQTGERLAVLNDT